MATPTKDELLDLLEQANAEKEELQKKVLEAEARVREAEEVKARVQAQGAGWLVISKNPAYNGEVFGIQFVNGQAFVPASYRHERFEVKPEKTATLKRRGLSDEEIKAIREKEGTAPALLCVDEMVHDLGYQAHYHDGSQESQEEIDAIIQSREKDIQKALEANKGRNALEKMLSNAPR